jgi:SnoaL-like protein
MALSTDDRLAIHELLNLHGHFMDAGAFDRLSELFTVDVGYDTSAFGGEVMQGAAQIIAAGRRLGENNPVGHHVTNILVGEDPDGTVRARSKGIGVYADGSAGSVVYDDILQRVGDGWRIAWRTVTPRRTPLRP